MATETTTRDIEREISHAREGLRDMLDKGSERASHYKDVAMERGRDAIGAMRHQIELHPFAIVGGVFVAGIALGMLMRRR